MNGTTQNQEDVFVSGIGIFITVLTFILGVLVITLNTVVIRTLGRRDRTAAVYLLLNLALSDLLTGYSDIYSSFYRTFGHYYYRSIYECLTRQAFVLLGNISCLLHLILLTVERYITVCHPYHHDTIFTPVTVRLSSYTCWITSLTAVILPYYLWGTMNREEPVHCHIFVTCPRAYIGALTGTLLFGFLLIIILYIRIFLTARRHIKSIDSQLKLRKAWSVDCDSDASNQSKNGGGLILSQGVLKFTKTTTIIVGAFAICWAPGAALFIIGLSGGLAHLSEEDISRYLMISVCSVLANSLINPLIYAAKMADVRSALLKLVFCFRLKKGAGNERTLSNKDVTAF